jgi:four helix bundle protein
MRQSRLACFVNASSFVESKEIAERAFRFACRIVKLYEQLIRKGGAARALAPQLLDSGTSIAANLEEATAGQSKPDFIAKVSVSRKEARETVYWLRLLVGSGSVQPVDVARELDEADQLVRILTTIVINARASPNRG